MWREVSMGGDFRKTHTDRLPNYHSKMFKPSRSLSRPCAARARGYLGTFSFPQSSRGKHVHRPLEVHEAAVVWCAVKGIGAGSNHSTSRVEFLHFSLIMCPIPGNVIDLLKIFTLK
ncbi:uncharacterized protein LAJ45_03360 [Morchella importuna]|uniref:uncharacterized protein n=1 Tax=Morchella importuna TaxID=1174673 RepID=UPI001E8CEB71|nr:uncharacterized protein LAJ45_03360 [Morchella importuna]KAH8152520.1 hypothetical protein LAJ45_03360 [Morchella importuna]